MSNPKVFYLESEIVSLAQSCPKCISFFALDVHIDSSLFVHYKSYTAFPFMQYSIPRMIWYHYLRLNLYKPLTEIMPFFSVCFTQVLALPTLLPMHLNFRLPKCHLTIDIEILDGNVYYPM